MRGGDAAGWLRGGCDAGWQPDMQCHGRLRDVQLDSSRLGFAVPERHADHIVGLYPSAGHPSAERLVERLEGRGIHVAARWGAVRVSPYLYNSAADVERLCAALADLVAEAAAAEPTPRL